jgi:glutamate N-acetyltransferase/amino-acid N-acetyltransferase
MKQAIGEPRFAVRGYRYAGVACGLKESGRRDVALIVSDVPARLAASFTTNAVKAAPVVLGQERAARGWGQAILVNSGNANAYTGRDGLAAARALSRHAARLLKIAPELVLPSSTGRIGCPLPRAKVIAGIDAAVRELAADGAPRALEGMMTTDAFGKFAVRRLRIDGRDVEVAGLAKGAGMIAPHMATMLAYILTDAAVGAPALRRVLREALPSSFNAIVVDGDMSTNDTVLLLANGVAGNRALTPRSRDYRRFAAAVGEVMAELARMIVKDGEGATKVVDILVRGARSQRDAERVADAIARSPLCKTAFYGGDPYAGRVVCAAGYSGARFDPQRLDVFLDDVAIVRRGVEVVRKVEGAASAIAARDEFRLTLDLHAGKGTAQRVTSDLTVDYVRFNSDYRT